MNQSFAQPDSIVRVMGKAAQRVRRWTNLLRTRQLHVPVETPLDERREERAQIARELHDTLFQGLFGASMQLHVILERMPDDSPHKASLERVLQQLERSVEDGRNTIRGLRSANCGALDLEHALSKVRDDYASSDGVDFQVLVSGRPKALKPAIQDEIYSIGREALINAFQHSRPSRVEVEAEYSARRLRLVVRDNGCGIDPGIVESDGGEHWGLIGMRERAERIGARLRVWSSAGAGTEIEVSVPGHGAFDSDVTAFLTPSRANSGR